jgi:hypothetical protein
MHLPPLFVAIFADTPLAKLLSKPTIRQQQWSNQPEDPMATKPAFPSRPCPKCGKPIHIKAKRHEACGWVADDVAACKTAPAANAGSAAARNGGTTGAYCRRVFKENRAWLKGRSNDEILKRWLADHPGHKEVPGNIKEP